MIETKLKEALFNVSNRFAIKGEITSIEPYGDGHINTTFKVESSTSEADYAYILQKINTKVFVDPDGLMDNIVQVTTFMEQHKGKQPEGYEILTLVMTLDDDDYYIGLDGSYWRMYIYVENSIGYTNDASVGILYEAGLAIGYFQRLLEDFPAISLKETIQDFHNTSARYSQLMKSYDLDLMKRAQEVQAEVQFCKMISSFKDMLTEPLSKGIIPYRVTHNDTKINNVLMDTRSGKGLCVIDLDTVMPGSSLYDFGDAIRSCGSIANEDEADLDKVALDLQRFKAFTEGYLRSAGSSLTDKEIELLPYSCIVMTYECGMRFLADHLNGDIYFKIHRENHNLDRARNQLKLVSNMLTQLDDMKGIIASAIGQNNHI